MGELKAFKCKPGSKSGLMSCPGVTGVILGQGSGAWSLESLSALVVSFRALRVLGLGFSRLRMAKNPILS